MSHGFEFVFTSLESFLFGNTSGSADFNKELLGILTVLNHSFDLGLGFRHFIYQCYYYHSNNKSISISDW